MLKKIRVICLPENIGKSSFLLQIVFLIQGFQSGPFHKFDSRVVRVFETYTGYSGVDDEEQKMGLRRI